MATRSFVAPVETGLDSGAGQSFATDKNMFTVAGLTVGALTAGGAVALAAAVLPGQVLAGTCIAGGLLYVGDRKSNGEPIAPWATKATATTEAAPVAA